MPDDFFYIDVVELVSADWSHLDDAEKKRYLQSRRRCIAKVKGKAIAEAVRTALNQERAFHGWSEEPVFLPPEVADSVPDAINRDEHLARLRRNRDYEYDTTSEERRLWKYYEFATNFEKHARKMMASESATGTESHLNNPSGEPLDSTTTTPDGDDSPPQNPPADPIPARARKAGAQYKQACEAMGLTDPTDKQVYNQIKTALQQAGEQHELPNFDTWQRNLREYRRLTKQQKNAPLAGRGGRSFVRPNQIELKHLPAVLRTKKDA